MEPHRSDSRRPSRRRPHAAALLLLAALLVPVSAAPADDPWQAKPLCAFGMPYIGLAVMPRQRGIITTLLRRVFEPEGLELRHEPMPYARARAELARGEIQCTLEIGDRRPDADTGHHPLLHYDLAVARLAATPWNGPPSLRHRHVAATYGFDLAALTGQPCATQLVFDLTTAFPLLEDHTVDFVLADVRLLTRALRESGLRDFLFAIDPIASFPVRPRFAPTPQGRRLRDIYDRRMQTLAASGDLADLLAELGLPPDRIRRLLQAQ